MWPDAVIYRDSDVIAVSVNHGTDSELTFLFNIFDSDKGDLNKAVEFYGLSIVKHIDKWVCGKELIGKLYYYGRDLSDLAINKDRNLSMQQAVTAASGANQTKEDEI